MAFLQTLLKCAPLLSYFSMQLGYIELEKVCISLIWNLTTFWYIEKIDEYPSLIISEIMDCERGVYLNV